MAKLGDEKISEAIDLCEGMLDKAYCIYSKFSVAAVLITSCGKVFTGCNVENASYGLCICAERTAVVKAVSEGYRKFDHCFVLTSSASSIAPCGACRQFLAEFNPNMTLYLIGKDRKYQVHQLKELLPFAFTPADLQSGVVQG